MASAMDIHQGKPSHSETCSAFLTTLQAPLQGLPVGAYADSSMVDKLGEAG